MLSNYYGYGEGKTLIRGKSEGLIPKVSYTKKSSKAYCLVCGVELKNFNAKLCSNKCRKEYRRNKHKTVYAINPELFNHRGLNHIKLMNNPFKNIIKTENHHINNVFTVPLPQVIHRKCNTNNRISHRDRVKEHWIYDFLGIDAIITENMDFMYINMYEQVKNNDNYI